MGVADQIWGEYPVYYKQPLRWLKYHAHSKPHFVFAVCAGVSAPVLLWATPLRHKYIYSNHAPIPYTYPLPDRPRDKNLSGYDD